MNANPLDNYFISGCKAEQNALRGYFSFLAAEAGNSQEQFVIIRKIANTFLRQGEYGRLINFLSSRIHQYPDDPYNAFYLFKMAYAYLQLEAYPIAALYFDMLVKNFPDLEIFGNSIHLASLKQLVTLVDDPQKRIWYYHELIYRFIDQIDPGPTFFMLGQAYERVGEWNNAIMAYTRFLSYTGSTVPGFPDADEYAWRLVNFNNSAKDWTFESLDALTRAVKGALDAGSAARLRRYYAKVNFFTRTWDHEDTNNVGVAGHVVFNLSDFMRGNRIRFANSLHMGSTTQAYLRTWGWSQAISVWYFYFRKIHFPADPAIHGRWEWAGIYYGERF